MASASKTKRAADLNAFQISIGDRDTTGEVYLTGLVLDGNTLGDFTGSDTSYLDWLVTGSDMNLTDGFTLTGTLWLEGSFLYKITNPNPENSVVSVTAGWDSRGVPPAVPDSGTTLAFLGDRTQQPGGRQGVFRLDRGRERERARVLVGPADVGNQAVVPDVDDPHLDGVRPIAQGMGDVHLTGSHPNGAAGVTIHPDRRQDPDVLQIEEDAHGGKIRDRRGVVHHLVAIGQRP